jgi:ABC-2 type transport system permease protein
MLPIIFVLPIVQLLILANAANFEVKNTPVHIIDFDRSSLSRQLIGKFESFPYFRIQNTSYAYRVAMDDFSADRAKLIVTIPPRFERDLIAGNFSRVQLIINAIDGSAAGIIGVYASGIVQDFNREIISDYVHLKTFERPAVIHIRSAYWYNPFMNYKTFMVPGILVLLVTMIGMFLAGMNIVREKEMGTIEQINVTPIKKYQFITGKLLPFWILALFELAFGLLVSKLVFDIPVVGSIWLIFFFAGIYLLVVLGIGLMVSTLTETQQQAMFISWFIMVVFILMSGLFTPIESMPAWAQEVTRFNPVAYFIEVMRLVMLKGSGIGEIKRQLVILSVYAFAVLGLATWRYKKVT